MRCQILRLKCTKFDFGRAPDPAGGAYSAPPDLFVADFLQAKCDFLWKSAVLRFWDPLGDLRATYDDHLRLIGKRVVDFLLVLTELFFARCYGWGATGEYRLKIGDFAPTGASWPKISGRRGRPPTIHSSSQKTRLNDLSYDIKIWTDLSSILSQSKRVTDRQTDGRTDGQNSHR